MSDPVLGAFLQVLFDKLATPLIAEVKKMSRVGEELDKLKGTVEHIGALLRDAETKKVKAESLANWLRDLQEAVYDADDVVDEFFYEVQRYTIESSSIPRSAPSGGRVRKRDRFKSFISSMSPSQISFRRKMANKIEQKRSKLDGISSRSKDLNIFGSSSSSETKLIRETTSFVCEPYVAGRSSEKEQIVKTLLAPYNNTNDGTDDHSMLDLSVLPIVGIPGIGKTTLAQLIFNDDRVKRYFDLMMWVCVSADFDVNRLTRQIFESATDEKVAEVNNLDKIQKNLSDKLKGRRFLLVLDDVWNRDTGAWQQLRVPLIQGGKGSKVLLTTRLTIVADTMGTLTPVHLKGLFLDDCLLLLRKSASSRRDIGKSHISEEICRKIVDGFDGAPLVVKTVGRILSSKDESRWREILDGEIWEQSGSENSILPVLKLSYQDLPAHLKRCLAYCSLFPKRHQFDRSKLVKLWIAQGYIQKKGGKRYEDVGNDYFEELLSMSFFQRFNSRYIMYDLFHDLTQYVPNQGCIRVEHEDGKRPSERSPHHLSFSIPKLKVIEDMLHTRMRSLIYVNQHKDGFGDYRLMLPDNAFIKLTSLRVLDLSGSNIIHLSESIGNLIHLRFLDLSHTKIQELPTTISRLYNLFSLELLECPDLKEIPSAVTNLISLQYLSTGKDLISKLPGIGKLTSLQELELFIVSAKDGHTVKELQDMNDLRGRLSIINIQNVKTEEEAKEANLKSKVCLDELILKWSAGDNSLAARELQGRVLEMLQPPPNIPLLSIIGNGGLQPPSWMDNHSISNLTSIRLRDCSSWKILPHLGLLPRLVFLKMEYLSSLESVDSRFYGSSVAFPCLENLELRHLHSLKKWLVPTECHSFPRLEKFLIEDCPKLESFSLPQSVKCLKIEKCPALLAKSDFNLLQMLSSIPYFSCSYENSYGSLQSCVDETLRCLSSLEGLEICFCDEYMTNTRWAQRPPWMPYNFAQGRAADELSSPSRTYNNIHDSSHIRVFLLYASNFPEYPDVYRRDVCLRVRNFDSDDSGGYISLSDCLRRYIHSIKKLSVKGCLKLASVLEQQVLIHLTTLEKLEIENCHGLMELEWFPQQHDFIHLRSLIIMSCPELRIFPKLKLTVLEVLEIKYCENLVSMDLHDLSSLRCMEITDCPKLNARMFTDRLASLRELRLWRCPQLTFSVNVADAGLEKLTFLECLKIISCKDLKYLQTNLSALSSLKHFSIMDCPSLVSLPETGLPESLKELRIEGCPSLQERCQIGGADWHLVANVPKKIINCPTCHPYRCHRNH